MSNDKSPTFIDGKTIGQSFLKLKLELTLEVINQQVWGLVILLEK